MSNIIFTPLFRPEKILWSYPDPDPATIIDRVQSKSGRKFLRSLEDIKTQHELSVEIGPCSEEDFLKWQELYLEMVDRKNFDKLANLEWYRSKFLEKKRVYKLFVSKHEQLLGGKIITVSEDQIVRSAFKTSAPYSFGKGGHASLGLILDYYFLDHFIKRGYKTITGGSSRNLFGIVNSVGYLCYKLRLGYKPEVEINRVNFFNDYNNLEDKPFLSYLCENKLDGLSPELHSYKIDEINENIGSELKRLATFKELHDS